MALKKQRKRSERENLPQWPTAILSNPIKEVSLPYLKTAEFKKVVKRMFLVAKWAVGLAANQIGVPLRMFIIQIKRTPTRPNLTPIPPSVVINPEIISISKEIQYGWEGCVSMPRPGLFFFVPRAKHIKVKYYNEKGKPVTKEFEGLPAVVFQHELDHLDGKFCGEQVLVVNGKVAKGSVLTRKEYKKDPFQIPEGARHLLKEKGNKLHT